MPIRHQISRARGWRFPAGAAKVDRTTRFGNPFQVGVHGDREWCVARHADLVERGMVTMTSLRHVEQQREHLSYVKANIHRLAGRDVACWCPPSAKCHGDTLLRLAASITCEEA